MACPLDGFAPPDRVYGMHRMLTSHAGDLVTVCDTSGNNQVALTIDTDAWTTLAEIEALAASYGTEVEPYTILSQDGSGEDIHFRPHGTYNVISPRLTSGGVAYRVNVGGVDRPCIYVRQQSSGIMGSAAYALHTSRFFLHAEMAQLTGDSFATTHFPAGAIVFGQHWDTSPPFQGGSQFLGYGGGGTADSSVEWTVMNDPAAVAYRNLSAPWAVDAMHFVSLRRDTNTSLQCFQDGALQQALTIANETFGATQCALFNADTSAGGVLIIDGWRWTGAAHWQSDPGDIGAALYTATLAAFGAQAAASTPKYQVSLRARTRLPDARYGAEHLPPSVARLFTGKARS